MSVLSGFYPLTSCFSTARRRRLPSTKNLFPCAVRHPRSLIRPYFLRCFLRVYSLFCRWLFLVLADHTYNSIFIWDQSQPTKIGRRQLRPKSYLLRCQRLPSLPTISAATLPYTTCHPELLLHYREWAKEYLRAAGDTPFWYGNAHLFLSFATQC